MLFVYVPPIYFKWHNGFITSFFNSSLTRATCVYWWNQNNFLYSTQREFQRGVVLRWVTTLSSNRLCEKRRTHTAETKKLVHDWQNKRSTIFGFDNCEVSTQSRINNLSKLAVKYRGAKQISVSCQVWTINNKAGTPQRTQLSCLQNDSLNIIRKLFGYCDECIIFANFKFS